MVGLKAQDWRYEYWKEFRNRIHGSTLGDSHLMSDGKIFHSDIFFELKENGFREEFFPEDGQDKFYVKMQRGNDLYILPKRFLADLPIRVAGYKEVRLKKSENTVYKFITNPVSLKIPTKKFWTFKETIEGFNPQENKNSRAWTLSKIMAFCNNLKLGYCGPVGCVDADTEFLSQNGWKRIVDWDRRDKVMQYNIDGTSEFIQPLYYIKQPCSKMYQFSTKYGIDQCLSPEHTIIYKTKKSDDIHEIKCEDMVNRHKSLKGNWGGQFITTFSPSLNTSMMLTDEELRLMVAVIADGTFQHKRSKFKGKYDDRIVKINLKKAHKKSRLVAWLEACGIEYESFEEKNGFTRFMFIAPEKKKYYDESFWVCNINQLRIIADECLYWDGSLVDKKFSTTNKESADFIQYCFTSCGYRSYISTLDRRGQRNGKYIRKSIEYSVTQTTRILPTLNSKSKKIISEVKPYDGFEYCFTVPSGMLILRRNNKIFITGNCGKGANFTIMSHMVGRYVTVTQAPTVAKHFRDIFYNDYIIVNEITSWPKSKVIDVEDLHANMADDTPDFGKYSCDSNKLLEIMDTMGKSLIYTFNPVTKKNPIPFHEKFMNSDKILDRYPMFYFDGKITNVTTKPTSLQIKQQLDDPEIFMQMQKIAANAMYWRENVYKHTHGWNTDKLNMQTARHRTNINDLLIRLDVLSDSQMEFDAWMEFLNMGMSAYDAASIRKVDE